ncbi:sialic acid-binding Ig-like lectin 14 isoform X1 [Bombina bombina]|uniref:sialic acid-binding Ig-like lectin 14 isoform X1 n=1 Tax=Bombina bombina TaxID=8345 RepID=UPI00235AE903|nr:sialic acid-binding Ig-like lectin 14 isoform X1 [Bombina bombina]
MSILIKMLLGQCCCHNYCPAIFIILFLSWEGLNGELLPGFSIQATKELTVQRGLCVYIPCRFTYSTQYGDLVSADSQTIWFRNYEFYLSSKPVLLNPLNEQIKQGDCSLKISDVSMENQGEYYFKIEGTDRLRFNYGDIKPCISVTELTEKPQISPDETLLANKEVTLTCIAPGRCAGTAPIITWEGNLSNRTVAYNMMYTDGNSTYYSNITFTPSYKDNSASLTCKVTYQSPGFPTTSDKMTLNVGYAPRRPVVYNSNGTVLNENDQELYEGSSFFMKCTAESSPPATFYWLKPNNYVLEGHEINVNGLLETDYGLYMCKATNRFGTSSISVNIIRKSNCRCVDSKIIVGIAVVIIVLILLIGLGIFCFLRRTKSKGKKGDKEEGHEVNEGSNSVYQDILVLKGQTSDIYHTLNMEK